MNIIKKKEENVNIVDLEVGDTFEDNGRYYIKICYIVSECGAEYNVANLETGELFYYCPEETIRKVNLTASEG